MKRLGKAFVALATATAMGAAGFAGVSTAMADGPKTGELTINDLVAGDEFKGYRLLGIESYTGNCPTSVDKTGTETTPDATEEECKIVYSVNSKYAGIIIKAANAMANADLEEGTNPTVVLADGATNADIKKWITENITNTTSIDAFAKAFMQNIGETTPDLTISKSGITETGNGQMREIGYYLFDHTRQGDDNATGQNESYTRSKYMVATLTEGGLAVTPKNDTVIPDKNITNPNLNDLPENNPEGKGHKVGSYGLGDTVQYELTGALPDNYDDFTSFMFKFNDTMTKGLTFVEGSMELKVNGNTAERYSLVEGAVPESPANSTAYWQISNDTTTKEDPANPDATVPANPGGQKLVVDFVNLKTFVGLKANDVITVTYKVVVNDNAVVYTYNDFYIDFSRDWNNPTVPTSTPTVTTTVVSFELDLDKVDRDGESLAGAEFTLYRVSDHIDKGQADLGEDRNGNHKWDNVQAYEKVTGGDLRAKTATFSQLSAGSYKLVETKTPDGYNTIDPIEFEIVAKYGDDNKSIKTLEVWRGNTLVSSTNANDQNAMFTVNLTNGTLASQIENVAGSKLPSTGGMGTMMLYIVGGLIVLAAAGGLTVAVRKRQN